MQVGGWNYRYGSSSGLKIMGSVDTGTVRVHGCKGISGAVTQALSPAAPKVEYLF